MEKFQLVKPKLSQFDVLNVEAYCYIMGYKFVYNDNVVLINNSDGTRCAYIQNGVKKEKYGDEVISQPVLNVVYGTEKICLTDLIVLAYKMNDFTVGKDPETIKNSNLYAFMRELAEIDFFHRYEKKQKSNEFAVLSMSVKSKNYAEIKQKIYKLITLYYPAASILFREIEEGKILIVSKNVDLSYIKEYIDLIHETNIIYDKGLYESLRYAKKYPPKRTPINS